MTTTSSSVLEAQKALPRRFADVAGPGVDLGKFVMALTFDCEGKPLDRGTVVPREKWEEFIASLAAAA